MTPQRNPVWSFHANALAHPDRTALWVGGVEHTYGELAVAAQRVAGWLKGTGLGPGDRVGVLGERGFATFAGILGACWAGGTYVPLSPHDPTARLARVVERAGLHALVHDPGSSPPELPDDEPPEHLLAIGAEGDARLDEPAAVGDDADAYLMFTSGTTDAPRGVPVSSANLRHFVACIQQRFALSAGDRVSQFFDPTLHLSVFDLFATWDAGAALYVVPDAARMSPVSFVQERELTVWFSVPSALTLPVRLGALREGSLPSLRVSLFGGEPLSPEAVARWKEAAPHSRVENLYGPIEATVACLAEPCSDGVATTPRRGTVAIGRAFPGTHAEIVDERGGFAPANEPGELVLSGVQVTRGYWDDPELTAERYPRLRHPELGERVWYRTGDLAYRDVDGRFHHLSRLDGRIKVGGHRIELEEVDAVLREACGSDRAAAVGWPLENGTAQGVVAFIDPGKRKLADVKALLRDRLPTAAVPRRFVVIDELPATAEGEVDRTALVDRLDAEARDSAA